MKQKRTGLALHLATLATMKEEVEHILKSLVAKIDYLVSAYNQADQVAISVLDAADGRASSNAGIARTTTRAKGRKPAGRKVQSTAGDLPAKLKAYREKNGINQDALAERLSIHVASIRMYEQGRYLPRPGVMAKIAGLLGIEVDEIKGKPKSRKVKVTPQVSKTGTGETTTPTTPTTPTPAVSDTPEPSQAAPEEVKTEVAGS